MPIRTFQQIDLIAAVALAQPAVTAVDCFVGAVTSFFTPYQD